MVAARLFPLPEVAAPLFLAQVAFLFAVVRDRSGSDKACGDGGAVVEAERDTDDSMDDDGVGGEDDRAVQDEGESLIDWFCCCCCRCWYWHAVSLLATCEVVVRSGTPRDIHHEEDAHTERGVEE